MNVKKENKTPRRKKKLAEQTVSETAPVEKIADQPKKTVDFSKREIIVNQNADEQCKVLLYLLTRAQKSKLDLLGIAWCDEDKGMGGYADYFDYPQATLADMLRQLAKVVELS